MVMISSFAEGATTSLPDASAVSSRRALLGRLAGLGLVAAGGRALVPDEAEAKRKPRRQRRRAKPTRKQGGTLSAEAVRDHRTPRCATTAPPN